MKDFLFIKGQKIKRTEVHKKLAGSGQGGINPTRHGEILIFSDPKVGEKFGYHDGWKGESYLYSGEGQEGDMEFKKGNKAIRDHRINGANIYLFFGSKGVVTYENQFVLDEENPYVLVDAKDKNQEDRQAIIFKLNPIENYNSLLPKTNLEILAKTTSELVAEEAFESETSERKQEEKIIISQRKESKLMDQFRKYREKNGQSVLKRYKIKINSNTYWTDGWCEDEQMLIEAKSSSSRNHLRLAIGQLMDYRRHIKPRPKKLAILVPTKPQEDLIDLILELEIQLIYKEGNTFIST
jgi:hypothetical protein